MRDVARVRFAVVILTASLHVHCERRAAPNRSTVRAPTSASASAAPIAATPKGPLAHPTAARAYVSRDRGRSWLAADNGLPRSSTVNDLALAHEAVLASTEKDGVYVTRDLGSTWSLLAATPDSGGALTSLVAATSVLVAGSRQNGVFASADIGKTWVASNSGLENREIHRLAVDGQRIFAATNGGVFVTENAAVSWQHLTGSGQTNAVVVVKGVLYVADIQGVLRSPDDGRSWERVYDGATPHNLGSNGRAVFAMLYHRGVIRSLDGGSTWSKAQQGLPDDLAQYTFQIIAADGALFGAQWHGIYVSESGGDTWRSSGSGLASNQAITDIVRVAPNVLLAAAVGSVMKP